MNPLAPLRRSFVRRHCLLVALDDPADFADAPVPQGVDIRPVTGSSFRAVAGSRGPAVAELFGRMLVRGDRGVYAWQDGMVVGHFWAIRGPRRVWGGVDVKRREALLAWGHVREDLRGRGVFQAMIRALVRDLLRDQDVDRVLADLPLDSSASLAAHRRCGFRLVGDLRYVSVFGVVLSRRLDPAS